MTDKNEKNTAPSWLAQLEKQRQQREGNRNPAPAAFPAEPPVSPEERRDIYRRYLRQWQQKHNLHADENSEYAVVFEEEWARNSENLLTRGNISGEHTVLLHAPDTPLQAAADVPAAENTAEEPDGRALWVRVAEPKIPAARPAVVVGENALTDTLCKKLAPHAADAVSGMVGMEIRRALHQAENTLRENLMREIAPVIEDIVRTHVTRAINQLKKQENQKS